MRYVHQIRALSETTTLIRATTLITGDCALAEYLLLVPQVDLELPERIRTCISERKLHRTFIFRQSR